MKQKKEHKKVQQDLPEMKGPGVEAIDIPEINRAAKKYLEVRDTRMKLTEEEVQFKAELIEAMHKHQAKLPKKDGETLYRFEVDAITSKIIRLSPGEEALSIKTAQSTSEAIP